MTKATSGYGQLVDRRRSSGGLRGPRPGDPDLGPVCILIAAYREAGSLPAVLAALPREAVGLHAAGLVVDDGSDDATAHVARECGAFVCRAPETRGQGEALRLGYRLAANGGASFVVTTDADGQYDPNDIEVVLSPVVDGEADFVSGSRRLGTSYRGDDFRRLGVVTYAKLISLLTGRSVTDPSFGLRAMRVEVPAAVQLDQPQYQASELLIGVATARVPNRRSPGDHAPASTGKSRKDRSPSTASDSAASSWPRGVGSADTDADADDVGPTSAPPRPQSGGLEPAVHAAGPRWKRSQQWWVLGLAVVVAALGSWQLGRPTFWNDEAATWAISGHGFGDLLHVLSTSGGDRGAALYYVVAFGWMRMFGTTEVACDRCRCSRPPLPSCPSMRSRAGWCRVPRHGPPA